MTPTTLSVARRNRYLPFPAATPFAVCGCVLLVLCAIELALRIRNPRLTLTAICVAVVFTLLVLALRAATLFAAFCGLWIAFIAALTTGVPGFTALTVLFVSTWTSTRVGRERKQRLGTAESRRGRKASQVFANLGAFALLAAASVLFCQNSQNSLLLAGAAAALAEAAGDTASSELGQVFGGTPFLITRFTRVPAGTDGGVTPAGTLAGCCAAALVLASWAVAARAISSWMLAAFIGAIAGIMFDSLLGATLERRGWLNNDGVNFLSTCFAALLAIAIASR